ncbi:MAG: D-beta-D-heptose 7-phosphate kinase/D-beta-D-heptose 1-phosphate adenosyltransferase [Gammaproteobacteria bacterium]|jgi:D-beta-D-heptose 7-phosphate kinase/D-beta-D-heptose 1-phosphate adenosyltransferase
MIFPDIDTLDISVVVVGDVMLDRYWQGATERISPEAPVPVVHLKDLESRPGGAGNVALNIAALGIPVTLFGVIGTDDMGRELTQCLIKSGVDAQLLASNEVSTISKMRVLSRHQQLIRLDQEQDLSVVDTLVYSSRILQAVESSSVVILSDYNKGSLKTLCPSIIEAARKRSVPVIIDPKGFHQDRYRSASVLTPNMAEFSQMVGDCENEEDIRSKGRQLIDTLDLEGILLTRSEKGMMLITRDTVVNIPSRVREVFDVTGAGDTVIAIFSAMIAAGNDYDQSARTANHAAGIVVGKLGAATIDMDELALNGSGLPFEQKIESENGLLPKLDKIRGSKRIVMTNGCFDLLQPGHIANLEQCRALGDLLVVAVNDDDSVSRLKGPSRPINPLLHRMQVIAGLGAVDYVVSFPEDTPERLISNLLPDVLAKGGDYKIENIAGAEAVINAGGTVETIDLVKGFSSSDIIKRIRALE